MSYLIRRVLAKPRLILDEMRRLYGNFASYLRCVLCKTRLIFPHINGPIVTSEVSDLLILFFYIQKLKNSKYYTELFDMAGKNNRLTELIIT